MPQNHYYHSLTFFINTKNDFIRKPFEKCPSKGFENIFEALRVFSEVFQFFKKLIHQLVAQPGVCSLYHSIASHKFSLARFSTKIL